MKGIPVHAPAAFTACAIGIASCLAASCGGAVGNEEQAALGDATPDVGCTASSACAVTLADGQDPSSITVDATHVYWTDVDGAGTVKSVPIEGGELTTLASGQTEPRGLAVDAARVYWIAGNAVMSVPLGGGTATTLASGQVEPWQLAVDKAHVYWTDVAAGNVMSAPLSGGAPTTLASRQPWPTGIAVGASGVCWTNGGTPPEYTDGAVMLASLDGASQVTLASGIAAYSLALFGGRVYFTDAGDGLRSGRVMSVGEGGGPRATLASGQLSPWAIAVDGASPYWTTDDPISGRNSLMGLTWGAPVSLWASGQELGGVVSDATSVYWSVTSTPNASGASNHDGRVMKIAPK